LNEIHNVHPNLHKKVLSTKGALSRRKIDKTLSNVYKSCKAWTRSNNTTFLSHAQKIKRQKDIGASTTILHIRENLEAPVNVIYSVNTSIYMIKPLSSLLHKNKKRNP